MPLLDSLSSFLSLPADGAGATKLGARGWPTLNMLALACVLACTACTQQKQDAVVLNEGNPNPKASAPVSVVLAGPRWLELTNEQRLILRPLATTWDSLASTHKSKWIAVTQGFPARSSAEQQKMQERMAAWAALTPVERERARLNFAETKKLNPTDRAAEWAAYQELSAEEKKRLAAKSPPNPVGASVALSPVPNDKLTAVPVTRRTSQQPDAASVVKPQIDSNTLLPKLVQPAPSLPSVNPDPTAPVGGTPPITIDTLSPN